MSQRGETNDADETAEEAGTGATATAAAATGGETITDTGGGGTEAAGLSSLVVAVGAVAGFLLMADESTTCVIPPLNSFSIALDSVSFAAIGG